MSHSPALLCPFNHTVPCALVQLINKAGKETFVKFHWKPTCGVKSLLEEEAVMVGGSNHSHATQDLYDTIASGNFPEWKLMIQTMNPADQDKFDFDPLDDTKIWPEDMFPLQVHTSPWACLVQSLIKASVKISHIFGSLSDTSWLFHSGNLKSLKACLFVNGWRVMKIQGFAQ